MSEKPILFSTPMVQAILNGHKTQTRRVIKEAKDRWAFDYLSDDMEVTAVDRNGDEYGKPVDGLYATFEDADGYIEFPVVKSKYRVGDILWVRESFCRVLYRDNMNVYVHYKADVDDESEHQDIKWKPSIHMPRNVARIFLRVTDVRVERVQEIKSEDCYSEGVNGMMTLDERRTFRALWNEINAKRGYGWDTNPFVWVYTFERVTI